MNEIKTIDSYIESFSPAVQSLLKEVYTAIKETVPTAEETISYGMPTFKIEGKNLVHFAAFANHIGFYPTPDGITQFQKELSAYKSAKGSAQFPLNKPLPLDLIKKITLFRLKQVKEKTKKK